MFSRSTENFLVSPNPHTYTLRTRLSLQPLLVTQSLPVLLAFGHNFPLRVSVNGGLSTLKKVGWLARVKYLGTKGLGEQSRYAHLPSCQRVRTRMGFVVCFLHSWLFR